MKYKGKFDIGKLFEAIYVFREGEGDVREVVQASRASRTPDLHDFV